MKEKSEAEKIKIGENIAKVFILREDKGYNPKRYKTADGWGNKTALGIYETAKRIMEE